MVLCAVVLFCCPWSGLVWVLAALPLRVQPWGRFVLVGCSCIAFGRGLVVGLRGRGRRQGGGLSDMSALTVWVLVVVLPLVGAWRQFVLVWFCVSPLGEVYWWIPVGGWWQAGGVSLCSGMSAVVWLDVLFGGSGGGCLGPAGALWGSFWGFPSRLGGCVCV